MAFSQKKKKKSSTPQDKSKNVLRAKREAKIKKR